MILPAGSIYLLGIYCCCGSLDCGLYVLLASYKMRCEVFFKTYELMYDSLFQHETEFLEDNLALSGFTPFSSKFISSEEEYFDSDDVMTNRLHRTRSTAVQSLPSHDTNLPMVPVARQEFRRRYVPHGWPHKLVIISISIYLERENCIR